MKLQRSGESGTSSFASVEGEIRGKGNFGILTELGNEFR
jgi:hypothetical protein